MNEIASLLTDAFWIVVLAISLASAGLAAYGIYAVFLRNPNVTPKA